MKTQGLYTVRDEVVYAPWIFWGVSRGMKKDGEIKG